MLLLVLPTAQKLVVGKQLQVLCLCPQKVVFLELNPCSHDQIQLVLCKQHMLKKISYQFL
jgi:hypothetical protein